jgi:protein-S-isoprenylcysteine O-methyltransferase Ste14
MRNNISTARSESLRLSCARGADHESRYLATVWPDEPLNIGMIRRMVETSDNPGVRVPPPALYALAVLGGYLLNRRWPLPIADGVVVQMAAWALIVVWLALTVSSIGTFRRSRTSIVPIRPATTLVIAGPYRFTRNPMYVGLAMLTVAIGLFMDSWWPIVLLLPVLLVVRVFVIAPEERYLERRFGADYVGYTQRVRRWL